MMQIRIQKACSGKKKENTQSASLWKSGKKRNGPGVIYLHRCVSVAGWRRPSEVGRLAMSLTDRRNTNSHSSPDSCGPGKHD